MAEGSGDLHHIRLRLFIVVFVGNMLYAQGDACLPMRVLRGELVKIILKMFITFS